jgi:type IV pilus assembly protein PilM
VDECVLDFLPARQHGDQVTGLLVAVSDAAASASVHAAERAGLRVVGVDLAAFGLLRGAVPAADPHVTAVVDVGAHGMQVVVAENAQPRLVRYAPVGAGGLLGEVARALRVDEVAAEHLVREGARPDVAGIVAPHAERMAVAVAETLAFHAQSATRPVEAVLLTGRGAAVPGFGQFLATLSRLPVTLARPDAVFDVHPRIAKEHPVLAAWAVAGGLATGGDR